MEEMEREVESLRAELQDEREVQGAVVEELHEQQSRCSMLEALLIEEQKKSQGLEQRLTTKEGGDTQFDQEPGRAGLEAALSASEAHVEELAERLKVEQAHRETMQGLQGKYDTKISRANEALMVLKERKEKHEAMLNDANDKLEDQTELITNLRSQIEQLRESELRKTKELKKHIKETDKDKAARAILDARLADQRAHYTSLEEANNTLRTQLDTAVEHLQELEKVLASSNEERDARKSEVDSRLARQSMELQSQFEAQKLELEAQLAEVSEAAASGAPNGQEGVMTAEMEEEREAERQQASEETAKLESKVQNLESEVVALETVEEELKRQLKMFQLAEKNQMSRIADLETQVEAKEATSASVDASVGSAFGEISLELEQEKESKLQLAKALEVEQGQKKNLLRRIKELEGFQQWEAEERDRLEKELAQRSTANSNGNGLEEQGMQHARELDEVMSTALTLRASLDESHDATRDAEKLREQASLHDRLALGTDRAVACLKGLVVSLRNGGEMEEVEAVAAECSRDGHATCVATFREGFKKVRLFIAPGSGGEDVYEDEGDEEGDEEGGGEEGDRHDQAFAVAMGHTFPGGSGGSKLSVVSGRRWVADEAAVTNRLEILTDCARARFDKTGTGGHVEPEEAEEAEAVLVGMLSGLRMVVVAWDGMSAATRAAQARRAGVAHNMAWLMLAASYCSHHVASTPPRPSMRASPRGGGNGQNIASDGRGGRVGFGGTGSVERGATERSTSGVERTRAAAEAGSSSRNGGSSGSASQSVASGYASRPVRLSAADSVDMDAVSVGTGVTESDRMSVGMGVRNNRSGGAEQGMDRDDGPVSEAELGLPAVEFMRQADGTTVVVPAEGSSEFDGRTEGSHGRGQGRSGGRGSGGGGGGGSGDGGGGDADGSGSYMTGEDDDEEDYYNSEDDDEGYDDLSGGSEEEGAAEGEEGAEGELSIAAQLEAFAATSADYSGSTGGGGSRSGRVNFAEDERGERDGREHERGGRLGERERERDERSYHSASKASSVRSMETSSYHSASGSVRSAHSANSDVSDHSGISKGSRGSLGSMQRRKSNSTTKSREARERGRKARERASGIGGTRSGGLAATPERGPSYASIGSGGSVGSSGSGRRSTTASYMDFVKSTTSGEGGGGGGGGGDGTRTPSRTVAAAPTAARRGTAKPSKSAAARERESKRR